MSSNRGVVYLGPRKVEVRSIDYPKFVTPWGKEIDHGVIIRIVSTNICGSDQHMVRGRTTAPPGMVLGHEITGEIIEKGHDDDRDGSRTVMNTCINAASIRIVPADDHVIDGD